MSPWMATWIGHLALYVGAGGNLSVVEQQRVQGSHYNADLLQFLVDMVEQPTLVPWWGREIAPEIVTAALIVMLPHRTSAVSWRALRVLLPLMFDDHREMVYLPKLVTGRAPLLVCFACGRDSAHVASSDRGKRRIGAGARSVDCKRTGMRSETHAGPRPHLPLLHACRMVAPCAAILAEVMMHWEASTWSTHRLRVVLATCDCGTILHDVALYGAWFRLPRQSDTAQNLVRLSARFAVAGCQASASRLSSARSGDSMGFTVPSAHVHRAGVATSARVGAVLCG